MLQGSRIRDSSAKPDAYMYSQEASINASFFYMTPLPESILGHQFFNRVHLHAGHWSVSTNIANSSVVYD